MADRCDLTDLIVTECGHCTRVEERIAAAAIRRPVS
jgi:hypothetical protein